MVDYAFTNKAVTYLAEDFGSSSTTISLAAGEGAKFPALTGSQIASLVLENRRVAKVEFVTLTARSGDTLVVLRGQEGTVSQSWSAGAQLSLRATAAVYEAIVGETNAATVTADAAVKRTGDTMTGELLVDGGGIEIASSGTLTVSNNSNNHVVLARGGNKHTIFVGSNGRLDIQEEGGSLMKFPLAADTVMNSADTVATRRVADVRYVKVDGEFPMTGGLNITSTGPNVNFTDTDAPLDAPAGGKFGVAVGVNSDVYHVDLLDSDGVGIGPMGTITYKATGSTSHNWFIGNVRNATMDYTDPDGLPVNESVVTRHRGDVRYVQRDVSPEARYAAAYLQNVGWATNTPYQNTEGHPIQVTFHGQLAGGQVDTVIIYTGLDSATGVPLSDMYVGGNAGLSVAVSAMIGRGGWFKIIYNPAKYTDYGTYVTS